MYPALAVLNALTGAEIRPTADDAQPERKELHVLWVGGAGGMETDLVREAGVPYEAIPAAGVHGVGWRALPGNLAQLGGGLLAARRILDRYKPDVMFFTGGFVAVPVAIAGLLPRAGRPRPRSLVYVPDIEPGLALKTLSRFADRVAVTVEDTRAFFKRRPGVIVTGYPVRSDLQKWSREQACQALQLSSGIPTVFIFGGSKGSRSINQAVEEILPELLQDTQVIHVSGMLDWPAVQANLDRLSRLVSGEIFRRYKAFPYLHAEMGAAYTAADLIVCRAGASTLGELPMFGVPAILAPYPYAWRYQQVNAQFLARRGATLILQDAELKTKLLPLVRSLIHDRERLAEMGAAMSALAKPNAASKIAAELISLAAPIGGSL